MASKVSFPKTRKEMSLLERTLNDARSFLSNKLCYKATRKIVVEVNRVKEGFEYNVDYHAGDTPFPFKIPNKIVEDLQKSGEEVLNAQPEKNHARLSFNEEVSVFKPYAYLKHLLGYFTGR